MNAYKKQVLECNLKLQHLVIKETIIGYFGYWVSWRVGQTDILLTPIPKEESMFSHL